MGESSRQADEGIGVFGEAFYEKHRKHIKKDELILGRGLFGFVLGPNLSYSWLRNH